MPDRLKFNLLLILMALFSGCVGTQQPGRGISDHQKPGDHRQAAAYRQKVSSLQNDLTTLHRQADWAEAKQVAETAIGYSTYLAEEYQVVRPAIFHNVLIRLGLKDRGLCYHWTEDLIKRLQSLSLKSYQLHWGVAHQGSELREHNSVVITGKGQAFQKGMVLDPWRNSGDLFWALIKTDTYPWKELPPEKW